MQKNKSAWIVGGVIAAVLIVLFAWPKINNPNRAIVKRWRALSVDCLPAHTNANQHIHPKLEIIVDGKPELIPANIGIVQSCMAELHVHAPDGIIHVESVSSGKKFTLNQFLAVWGKELERPGFALEMAVDGAPSQEFGDLILKDGQQTVLKYAPNR